jgi:hypothetical protein
MDQTTKQSLRSGAEILVDTLVTHGTKHVFCVPGTRFETRRSRSPCAARKAARR